MKFNNILKYVAVAVAAGSLLGVTSCNYLDVVPPEQPGLEDAMKTHNNALGFLHSCYNGVQSGDIRPANYLSPFCSTTDEWVWPNGQESSMPTVFAVYKNTQTTANGSPWVWGEMYRFIGQCLLFEDQLTTVGRENGVTENAQEEKQWLAETRFLKAYYHYVMLRLYGPIPLTTELIDMEAPDEEFPGRSHFDYCVRYIANELDEAANDLPATRPSNEFGRATKVIAKVIKARLLLLAASDLYNGKFPYPEWKNVNFETPGYGRELISRTYDRQKWVNAYNATKEALDLAKQCGHDLMWKYEAESSVPLETMKWVPVDFNDDVECDTFLTKVMLNRYIHTTSQSKNPEILWSLRYTNDAYAMARLPLKVINKPAAPDQWFSGWSCVNPTLNTVYNFLCKDGRLPAEQHPDLDFPSRSDWFEPVQFAAEGHADMIQLVRNREPRFYAWIAFDGGCYLNRIKNGGPLILDFKNNVSDKENNYASAQGFEKSHEKDCCSTGFLSMKYLNPVYSISSELTPTPGTDNPIVLARLSELYLNLAECAAELANPDRPGADASYKEIALGAINTIRMRAGVPELTESQLNSQVRNPATNTTKKMSLVEWVRQERFIELWDEGHRYFDIRRWVAGPEYLAAGVRQGLTGEVENPKFEEFNTPRVCNPAFTFATRQYLYPLFINEVYKNPQMIQAPGY